MTEQKTPDEQPAQQPAGGDVYDVVLSIIDDLGQQGIAKNGWNKHSEYKFRSIEDVLAAFNRLMVKYRLLIIPNIESNIADRNGKNQYATVTMRYTFRAGDGSSFDVTYAGQGGDVGDKAVGKAQTNALKQMLTDVFKIPADGMIDPDETTPDRNEAEHAQQRERIAEQRAREQARDRLLKTGARKGLDADGVIAWCLQQYNAHPKTATVQDLIVAEQELAKRPDKAPEGGGQGGRPQGSGNHPAGRQRGQQGAGNGNGQRQGRPPQQRNGQQGGGRPQGKGQRPGIPGQRPGSEPQQ